MARGGRRAGAGRPRGPKTHALTVRVSSRCYVALSTTDLSVTSTACDVLERWASAQMSESERILDDETERARLAALR